jgi:hypothetical protein
MRACSTIAALGTRCGVVEESATHFLSEATIDGTTAMNKAVVIES